MSRDPRQAAPWPWFAGVLAQFQAETQRARWVPWAQRPLWGTEECGACDGGPPANLYLKSRQEQGQKYSPQRGAHDTGQDSQVRVSGLTPPGHMRSEVTSLPVARLEGHLRARRALRLGLWSQAHLISAGVRAVLSCLISCCIAVCQVITGCETH